MRCLWRLKNDQFANNPEEDAEEVDTSLSSRFAEDIDFLGGSEEELQQLAEWLEKQLLIMAWTSA